MKNDPYIDNNVESHDTSHDSHLTLILENLLQSFQISPIRIVENFSKMSMINRIALRAVAPTKMAVRPSSYVSMIQ